MNSLVDFGIYQHNRRVILDQRHQRFDGSLSLRHLRAELLDLAQPTFDVLPQLNNRGELRGFSSPTVSHLREYLLFDVLDHYSKRSLRRIS